MENEDVENKGNYSLGDGLRSEKKEMEKQINILDDYCSEQSEVREIRNTKIEKNENRKRPIRLNILAQFQKDM
jgi:hypothetical protein